MGDKVTGWLWRVLGAIMLGMRGVLAVGAVVCAGSLPGVSGDTVIAVSAAPSNGGPCTTTLPPTYFRVSRTRDGAMPSDLVNTAPRTWTASPSPALRRLYAMICALRPPTEKPLITTCSATFVTIHLDFRHNRQRELLVSIDPGSCGWLFVGEQTYHGGRAYPLGERPFWCLLARSLHVPERQLLPHHRGSPTFLPDGGRCGT